MTEKKENNRLAALIERGGAYYDVPGASPRELLAQAIRLLPPIPSLDTQDLYREILEREALMSTGIGRGIAIPHPRNPLIGDAALPLLAVVFPRQPLDWNTPDGSKVHTVFLIVSSSAKQHLEALSKLNFLCQQENFYMLIKARASKDDIVAAVRETESSWENTA